MTRCSKVRYRDRIAALVVLAKITHNDSTGRAKTERRAYKCPRCHGWHLTSQGTRR